MLPQAALGSAAGCCPPLGTPAGSCSPLTAAHFASPALHRPHPSQQGISVDGMGDMGGGMSGAGLGLPPDDEDEEWKACNCESRDKGTTYDLSKGKKTIIKKLIRACPDENKVYTNNI